MENRPPFWAIVLDLLMMLPLFQIPLLLSESAGTDDMTVRTLVAAYPLVVVAAGVLAWISYRRRPEVYWILIVILALTHVGMFYLVK